MSNEDAKTDPNSTQMDRLRRAKALLRERLQRIRGVHSIGVGYKEVGGKRTDELAVLVYVDEKLPLAELDPEQLVPPDVRFHLEATDKEEVVPTDVIERARPVDYPHLADGALAGRIRPVAGGRSITTPSTGGTLGGWVWDDLNDQAVLLSNNHVLGGTIGTDVFQPWSSTASADRIADVVRTGTLDATIAAPLSAAVVNYEIEGVGPAVYEVAEATLGMAVEKSGATTEHTTGTVTAIDISSHYGGTYFDVARDPGIDRFAYYGDSGSLVVERTNPSGAGWKRVVGLLWGGVPADRNGFAHQITDVFADLDLEAVCAGIIEEILDSLFAAPAPMALAAPVPPRPEPLPMGDDRAHDSRWASRVAERLPWVRPGHRGFARDIEVRLATSDRGRPIVEEVHGHRIELLRLMLDRDIRRAMDAAVRPFVTDAWTVDEVFDRPISTGDVERFRRLHKIVAKRRPQLGKLLGRADELLDKAEGRTLGELLE